MQELFRRFTFFFLLAISISLSLHSKVIVLSNTRYAFQAQESGISKNRLTLQLARRSTWEDKVSEKTGYENWDSSEMQRMRYNKKSADGSTVRENVIRIIHDKGIEQMEPLRNLLRLVGVNEQSVVTEGSCNG